MASNYSTNLAFELPLTGSLSGTWGDNVNNNVGTLIEQAIVGVGSVDFASDADKTITMPNGTTSATRCFYLNVTSSVSLTITRNLIVPTIQKNYMVKNGTTGGQIIQVKTVAGTGVNVPNGSYVLLQVDGTNVIPQFTYVPSLDAPTQTAGDNTTKVATTAFVTTAINALVAVPSGVMFEFGGTGAAPAGYLLCDGSAVSRATYAPLFTAISTTWGIGDGSTTFNLPDTRRRVAVGNGGSGSSTLGNAVGNIGGEETHLLTIAEMPAHTHTQGSQANNLGGNLSAIGGGYLLDTYSEQTQSTGGGSAHNIIQPSYVIQKIIKT